MTYQHRYMIHGLTTNEQAEAIRNRMVGQQGIIDAQLKIIPPEALLTVDQHPSVADIQQLVSMIGSFHVMESRDEPNPIHAHHQASGSPVDQTHNHKPHTNPMASATESPAEQQALQHIRVNCKTGTKLSDYWT